MSSATSEDSTLRKVRLRAAATIDEAADTASQVGRSAFSRVSTAFSAVADADLLLGLSTDRVAPTVVLLDRHTAAASGDPDLPLAAQRGPPLTVVVNFCIATTRTDAYHDAKSNRRVPVRGQ